MKVRPIKKEFVNKGINVKLIKQKKDIALYITTNLDTGTFNSYEVHKLRTSKVSSLFSKGKAMKGYTHYIQNPSDNDFGMYGWTYLNLDSALDKFNKLLKS